MAIWYYDLISSVIHIINFQHFPEIVAGIPFQIITVVLCQEKVQVKSELFLQHSLFIQPVFPSYSISAHTHSRIHLVTDIHNDCGFLPYYKMSLCIQILIYRHGHNFLF